LIKLLYNDQEFNRLSMGKKHNLIQYIFHNLQLSFLDKIFQKRTNKTLVKVALNLGYVSLLYSLSKARLKKMMLEKRVNCMLDVTHFQHNKICLKDLNFLLGFENGELFLAKYHDNDLEIITQYRNNVDDPVFNLESFENFKKGYFLSLNNGYKIKLWDINNYFPLKIFTTENQISSMTKTLNFNNKIVIFGQYYGYINIWNAENDSTTKIGKTSNMINDLLHINQIFPYEYLLVSSLGQVTLWDLSNSKCINTLKKSANKLLYWLEDLFILAYSIYGVITVLNIKTFQIIYDFKISAFQNINIFPNSNIISVLSKNHCIVYEIFNLKLLFEFTWENVKRGYENIGSLNHIERDDYAKLINIHYPSKKGLIMYGTNCDSLRLILK
jgi:WD40 repeat protein